MRNQKPDQEPGLVTVSQPCTFTAMMVGFNTMVLAGALLVAAGPAQAQTMELVDWVNPLVGTDSKPILSNGNTYPDISRPWGMNSWTPQTGKMGDGWHYTWSVFHDVQGLMDLMGGRKPFVATLDTICRLPPTFDDSFYGEVIHEIKEMQLADMGQYTHGNQPVQHMPYLYAHAGQPWKTQYWVRKVLNRLYKPTPDSCCGDEDNGQTSTWYVFSALGFYPVCPATDQYVLSAPLSPKVTLHLPAGKGVVLNAPQNSATNRYVGALQLNGQAYGRNRLSHAALVRGATLDFEMVPAPNTARVTAPVDAPFSVSKPRR